MKTNKDNDVTEHIGLVYTDIKTKFSGISYRMRSVMKTRKGNNVTNCTSMFYVKNDTKLS